MQKKSKLGKWKPLIKFFIFASICILVFRFCSYIFTLTFFTLPNEKQNNEVPYAQFVQVIEKTFESNADPLLVETDKGKLYYFTESIVYETKITNNTDTNDKKMSNRTSASADILGEFNMPYDYFEFSWVMFTVFVFTVIASISALFLLFILMNFKGESFDYQNEKNSNNQRNTKKPNFVTEIPNVSLDDIGGLSPQVNKEVNQAIMLFEKHKEIKTFNIKPVNGILLFGPPGTGKTMLAKGIANRLNANYFQLNGPEFVERYVGVGPSRVRELFQEAKKNQPSVIFIDEIDAIGFRRESDQNSEIRSTLNQLLIELNDIQNLQTLFIASTNHPGMLDPALVRAGRFDYKINIDLPDIKGRREIIKVKSKNISMDEELKAKLDELARSMYRMSGADIENVFHKAQIQAISEDREYITYNDVETSIERVILGSEGRISHPESIIKRVAYHEAGHALLTSIFYPSQIQKATIIPHSGSLGLVLTKESEERELKTKTDLIRQICIYLAGGISEETYFKEHSIGVSEDFKQAKNIAKTMVMDLGMSLEGFSFTIEKNQQNEIKKIIDYCFDLTKKTINGRKDVLEKIANTLIDNESMTGEEIDLIVYEKASL